ncbi:hypothetical protein FACS189493_8660 [Spirochaetia bacterium]|nr:hypothetical protein FACS189493_8660 [Spirochaetia bacterium]
MSVSRSADGGINPASSYSVTAIFWRWNVANFQITPFRALLLVPPCAPVGVVNYGMK